MQQSQKHKLELLLARFVEWLQACNYSPRTRPEYERNVKELLNWLAANTAVNSVAEITATHLQQYQIELCHPSQGEDGNVGKALSISAQGSKLAAIKTFFKWLVMTQQLAHNPA